MHPFRFGVVAARAASGDAWLQTARRIESLGYDFRNPVLVAKEAASLDVLSGGRFELGIGAGRPSAGEDNRMLGIPFDSGGARVAHLAESLRLVKALLEGQRATASGPHYH